ncbi:MAG: GAF domain-containing protein [Chloroflexi bacterium]|nr:GAF domain-containing protein [Chloroflexota bacterium]
MSSTSPKILIINETPEAVGLLPEWLQREGYDTLIATEGQPILTLAAEYQPDVILMDVLLSEVDGIEMCRRLRLMPETTNIPVILVSERGMVDARAEGLLAGAVDYLNKPFQVPDLMDRLERLVFFNELPHSDYHRLLSETAQAALASLPCDLVWLLVADVESQWLTHLTLAMNQAPEVLYEFLAAVYGEQPGIRFPLSGSENRLVQAMDSRTPLINLACTELEGLAAFGASLSHACSAFELDYISVWPLSMSQQTIGIMVLATAETPLNETAQHQQLITALGNQAAMVVTNARLQADLAVREEQMRAEQAFRRMVLDTMGEGLVVVDQAARILYVNNRLLQLTGYSRTTLYGQSVGVIFHPGSRNQLVASLTGERRGTLPFSQMLFTSEEKVVPVLLSQAIMPSPDEEGDNTVMVVTDLSDIQRNEAALTRQTQRLQAIKRASDAITSARSFDEVVVTCVASALEIVQGVSASLLHTNGGTNALDAVASAGPNGRHVGRDTVVWGEGLAGWVASTGKSQLVVNGVHDVQFLDEYAAAYSADLHSLLIVPLVASDTVLGVLEVVNKTDGAFDEQDLEMLENLAGSASIAIENAHLLDQMRRRVTELSTLLDASAAASSTLDFGDILERIARLLSMALRVERVLITDWKQQTNSLRTLVEVVNAYWLPGYGPLRQFEQLSITRAVLEFGTPVLADDLGDTSDTDWVDEMNPSGMRIKAGFPIKIVGATVGIVALYDERSDNELASPYTTAVMEVVTAWQSELEVHGTDEWWSRSNLTDLCQRVSQASGARWCSVGYWDHAEQAVRILREVGHALWLKQTGKMWDVARYANLERVLKTGTALTLQQQELESDLAEQHYLRAIGGCICLVAPLLIRGEPGGLVKLIDSKHENRVFDDAELSLCQGITNVVGNAMENAQLYAAQEQRAAALEAAYRELQESDRIKNELLQNLSHELQTPLTHILGYLRLLLDEAFGSINLEQQETVRLVLNKSIQLANLVRDIVAVQQTEAQHLAPKPINLQQVIELAIHTVNSQTREREIEIAFDIPADLPLVHADPVRIGAVFEELLENAIKFSPDANRVELVVEDTEGPMLHAFVQDFGIGIEVDQYEKIFRRFYQVDSGTTRRFGGTGLGLAIVRQVVEGHRGQVWVESEPGVGSCFHLTLPKAN